MDANTLLVLGVSATIVLWAVTWARQPGLRGVALRGVGIAFVVVLVGSAIVVAVVTVLFNGRPFLFSTLDLGGAFALGLVVAGVLGASFFWLNAVVLAIGLWFKPGDGWAIGAVLTTPLAIAAVGFGFIAYNTYQYQSQQPQMVQGSVTLELAGPRLGLVSARGTVTCAFQTDGGLRIDADVAADDGRRADIQFSLTAGREVGVLALAVDDAFAAPGKGWEVGPSTTRLADGSTRAGGQITLNGLVPLGSDSQPDPTERWSGTFSWSCQTP